MVGDSDGDVVGIAEGAVVGEIEGENVGDKVVVVVDVGVVVSVVVCDVVCVVVGVVVCELVTVVVWLDVMVVVTVVVTVVVCVVLSHRRKSSGQSSVPALKLKHCKASFWQGPPVLATQLSQSATSSGSRQRLKLVGQVLVSSSSNPRQALMPSEVHGPNPIAQLLQCSGVVVCVAVAVVVCEDV